MCSLAEGQAEKINLIQKTAEREQKRYDLLYQSIGKVSTVGYCAQPIRSMFTCYKLGD